MRSNIHYRLLPALLLLVAACDVPDWLGDDEDEVTLSGERIAVLDYATGLEPDESVKADTVNVPQAVQNADYTQDIAPLKEGSYNLTADLSQGYQTATIGDGNAWETALVTPPVIVANVMFAMDAAGVITAHSASDPARVAWLSDGASLEDEADIGGGGLAYAHGVLYASTGYGSLMALVAKDGSLLWKQTLEAPIRAAPVVDDGKVFVISIDNQLSAYDARSGQPLWNHRGIKETAVYLGAVSPSVSNGIVIAAYTSGELVALRAEDGVVLWTDTLILPKRTAAASMLTGIDATPLIADNVVYAISNSGLMVANRLTTGQGMWDVEVAGWHTPWIGGDYVFVLSSDHRLLAIKRENGALKWVSELRELDDKGRDVTPALFGPVMVNGELLVTSNDGRMRSFSPQDGALLRTIEIPDDVRMAPLVANGRLYLIAADATIAVFP